MSCSTTFEQAPQESAFTSTEEQINERKKRMPNFGLRLLNTPSPRLSGVPPLLLPPDRTGLVLRYLGVRDGCDDYLDRLELDVDRSRL